jgi:hypothetical protein
MDLVDAMHESIQLIITVIYIYLLKFTEYITDEPWSVEDYYTKISYFKEMTSN